MIFHRTAAGGALFIGLLSLAPAGRAMGPQAPGSSGGVVAEFQAAQQELQDGNCERAIPAFREILQSQPALIEARVNLGLAYHACGDYELAASVLSEAVKQRPDLLPANLFLGLSYVKLGLAEKAIPPLARVLALDPTQAEARRALATAELSAGDYGRASEQFRRLAEMQADKAEAWFTLGHEYLQMAKQLTAELSARFHNSAWSLRLAGDILGERALWNDAAAAYGRALEQDPSQAGLYSSRARALLCAGRTSEAESDLHDELSRRPFDTEALLGLSEVQIHKGVAEPALEPLNRIWQTSPELLSKAWPDFPACTVPPEVARQLAAQLDGSADGPAGKFFRSALLRVAGDREAADREHAGLEDEIASGVRAERSSATPSRAACQSNHLRLCADFLASQKSLDFPDRLTLGRILLSLHQADAAADDLAAAVADSPSSPEARYWLNQAYLRLADECFTQLSASFPDSWRAHELKAETSHLRQDDAEAISEYQAAARLKPDDPGIHEALGELLLQGHQLDQGKVELETALRINPSAPRSLYLLGNYYMSEREPERAISYLEAALRYDPSLQEARPVLGKAYLKVGKADLAIAQLERSAALDRYGDLHYLLYQAYQAAGKSVLAAQALARSQELRRKSEQDDQAKIRPANQGE